MKPWQKALCFGVLSLIILYLDQTFSWSARLQAQETLEQLQAFAQEEVLLAGGLYLGVMVLASVLLALPGVVLAIVAGVMFPPLLATLLCVVASTLSAGLAFLLARWLLKDLLKPVVMKHGHLRRWLFEQQGQEDKILLLVTRLIPIFPFNLQNFAYGITDMPFGRYLGYSALFLLPGSALYTLGTASVVKEEYRALSLPLCLLFALFLFVLLKHSKKTYQTQRKPAETRAQDQGDCWASCSGKAGKAGSGCTSCGICTAHCDFLKQYQLDFHDTASLASLAYHCFLCGTCTRVCPFGVDGKEIFLRLRQEQVAQQGGLKGYLPLRWEKEQYRFRNDRDIAHEKVLFLGCNFPSFYPETTKVLCQLMKAQGIGIWADCCGKPIGELGLSAQEGAIQEGLAQRIAEKGIRELIYLCPNCHHFLQDRLPVKHSSIYQALQELGLGQQISGADACLFLPCPDRGGGTWSQDLAPFWSQPPQPVEGIQCCGLGGCASGQERELAQSWSHQLSQQMAEKGQRGCWVYCASCGGQFTRREVPGVNHVLSQILGLTEEADTKHSLKNRWKGKFL